MTTAQFFAERQAQLVAGVLKALAGGVALTGTMLRRELSAGAKELTRVLDTMRDRGLVTSRNRWWTLT